MRYEAPELFEVGMAGELTLGRPNLPCDDNCKCTMNSGADAELDCGTTEIQL